MARFAVGDIQGCYDEFMLLLKQLDFNPGIDNLYLLGDLVNRGPKSLEVLEWVYKHNNCVLSVLGNHDIYLLGRYAQVLRPSLDETIVDILNSTLAPKLIAYLRSLPLIIVEDGYLLVHAGVHPLVELNKLLELSMSVENNFKSNRYAQFISRIFTNKPFLWRDNLSPIKQLRFMVNSSTRMRFINAQTLALDYKYKGELSTHPANLIPWFRAQMHISMADKKIIFGHWAALGFMREQNFFALDSGCVWGRKLTALNLDTLEVTQVQSK